jgi:phosphopantothenoylcysteine decarboxylase/phosphopantothenate--cysteine ligase
VGGGLGFEAVDNALTLYWADGAVELPRASKAELARQLTVHVAERYRAARG